MSFVPAALRLAMGEYYTPDWLASHVLDRVGWNPAEPLTDPTCGSGTFILEALKRRLSAASDTDDADSLLSGLAGIDLNPIAVLTAKASLAVFLSNRLDPAKPVRLPLYLADTINPASEKDGLYQHSFQTEVGTQRFVMPKSAVTSDRFFEMFQRIRGLVEAELDAGAVEEQTLSEFDELFRTAADRAAAGQTIRTLCDLHRQGWDGIWCSVLADRFAAGAIPLSPWVCGNPPWVKWSNLPPAYAEFIKDHCIALGVFSEDSWVGGIESDISTVVTYEAALHYLEDGGRLGFLITGTVFANESSQGFRKWRLDEARVPLRVLGVEDFAAIAPFEGVTNHAALLLLKRGEINQYPVPYLVWERPPSAARTWNSAAEFRTDTPASDLQAIPVPGSDAGPWLIGTPDELSVWSEVFGPEDPVYRARKGITTDCNGVYFVRVSTRSGSECDIVNDPAAGRRQGIPIVAARVEGSIYSPC